MSRQPSDTMIRILHLTGSSVDDFHADLSRLYASDCLTHAAAATRYEMLVADVVPSGRWRFPTDLSETALASAPTVPVAQAIAWITEQDVDVVVPQMFDLPGMTHYRALLDILGLPYLGNTPAAMALTADKSVARGVVAQAGVSVPAGEVVPSGGRPTLSPPVVVKPIDADNSIGVRLVRHAGDLDAALDEAWSYSAAALVERYVPLGREVRCGTLERDDRLIVLPLEEYAVDEDAAPVRGRADKLRRREDQQLELVAKDPELAWIVDPGDPVNQAVGAAAMTCHRALGCRQYGLFDFRIDPDGHPWFLEAGLYCSFARQSVISTMAKAAGIGLAELFAEAVEHALHRA